MTKKMTVEQMRAAVEAHDAEMAAKKAAEQEAYLQPLVEVVGSDAFREIAGNLAVLAPRYEDDLHIATHLNALVTIIQNMTGEVQRRTRKES